MAWPAAPQGLQIVMEEISAELKLEAAPDPARAFDFTFAPKSPVGQKLEVARAD